MFSLRFSLAISMIVIPITALSQVPDYMSFQGRLADDSGDPIDDTVDLTIKLYQNGSEVYSQMVSNVAVDSGTFNVDLGPLSGVTFDQATELGVAVDADSEMIPRTPLRSVPYSHGLKLPFEGRGASGVGDGLFKLWATGGGAGVRVDTSAGPAFSVGYAATDGLEVKQAASDGIEIENANQNGILIQNVGNHAIRITDPTVDAIRIEDAGDDAIDIQRAEDNGVFIGLIGTPSAGNFAAESGNGIQIVGAEADGVFVGSANHGVHVRHAISSGIEIDSASSTGIRIAGTGLTGIRMERIGGGAVIADSAVSYGFRIEKTGATAFYVTEAGHSGVYVHRSGNSGFWVNDAGEDGVRVEDAGQSGLHVENAGDHGLFIENATNDGIRVLAAGDFAANLKRALNGASTISNHAALIHNNATTTTNGPDVLALKVQNVSPGTGTNFITFFNGNNAALGRIEGSGGGISYATGAGDFAEYLPHAVPGSQFHAGDVVGVRNGMISHDTRMADEVMVITDRAALIGNAPPDDETDGFEIVSFVGQVPIKVLGTVESGDYLVASGRNDGVAYAYSPGEISVGHLSGLVGMAWESSDDPGIKRVNAAVGLDHTDVLSRIVLRQQREIDELREAVSKALSMQIQ